jgi:hypothetical protein
MSRLTVTIGHADTIMYARAIVGSGKIAVELFFAIVSVNAADVGDGWGSVMSASAAWGSGKAVG